VEFVCGCLLIIGLLSTLCCTAFIIDMIVAIVTVQLATITKALSVIDWDQDGSASIAGSPSAPGCLMAFPPINGTQAVGSRG
jgi:hypothetical protein